MRLTSLITLISIPLLLVACRTKEGPNVIPLPTAAEFQSIAYDSTTLQLKVVMADGTELTHYGVPVELAAEFQGQPYKKGFYTKIIKPYYPTTPELEAEGLFFQPVQSKRFRGFNYDQTSSNLYLLLANGGVRAFSGVPLEIVQGFEAAPVKGAYYAGYIENAYPSRAYKLTESAPAEGGGNTAP